MSGSPVPLQADERPRSFVPELECLRGIAALLVAAFHAGQSPWEGKQQLLSQAPDWHLPINRALVQLCGAIFNGHGAVIVFFVLSGFVLSGSLERGPQQIGRAAWRFFIGRVFRIYPAAIVTVAIFAAVFWLFGLGIPGVNAAAYAPDQLLRNALLLEASINGVMWSLQVELLAAPIIFAAYVAHRRWGVTPTIILAVVLLGLGFHGPSTRILTPSGPSLALLYTFPLGVLVHQLRSPISRWLRDRSVGAWLAAITLIFFCARPVIGRNNWGALVEALAAASFIGMISLQRSNNIARLRWPMLRFYGRISFSFYLLHPLTLLVIWRMPDVLSALLSSGVPTALVAIAVFVASTAVITPLAWLSWRFVELPGTAIGSRLR
jgi:peptidoglycan/LPS O-acetylase OafA/YrhL